MIAWAKAAVARHWPVLRLRTILFSTLLLVAALPGFGALFLRVYENTLVRRTEGELIAQSAALAASAAILWAGPRPAVARPRPASRNPYDPQSEVDLRASPILPPRPAARATADAPQPDALATARRLLPAIEETSRTTLSSILMLDGRGILLNGGEAGRSLRQLPEIRSALAGRPATVLRENGDYVSRYPFEWLSRASNLRLHHTRPIMVDGRVRGVLLVSRSPRPLFKGMYEDRGKIVLGIVLIFGALIVLTAILSRAIVRPIERLSRSTRTLASGQPAATDLPSLQVVEIRDLFRDFAVMADSIDKRSRYLRDFASSVSHEFKTPLAGISGAIELLQDHEADMTPADRRQFLHNMAIDAERLSRLVRRLMELAKADLHRPGGKPGAALPPVLAIVADGLATAGFTVSIMLPEQLPRLAIDARTLEAVLTTLVDNARQAAASVVVVTAAVEDGTALIAVADDGRGIAPADRDRIFEAFFTTKREAGGTGLGLPIARSLVEAYGGTLTLGTAIAGARFEIVLPIDRVERAEA
ncbi:histidine kinase [Sphingomonas sp. Leaf22]|uniref:sensor histidine kinase n=1 Tax=Sphingomonas sp. Leaf22 TaxID=1735687 RepID=UPI0006F85FC1|nr:HAMP domain-containing sensor histidine kinase [Sphingomonas sp. Leaf22]KQM93426.1 histidine kinase [Sphingomonas sp. Leaf22]